MIFFLFIIVVIARLLQIFQVNYLASKMLERKFLVLYGSQTGTAQEVAERIWREAKWWVIILTLFVKPCYV